jgi:hypothetical protein
MWMGWQGQSYANLGETVLTWKFEFTEQILAQRPEEERPAILMGN